MKKAILFIGTIMIVMAACLITYGATASQIKLDNFFANVAHSSTLLKALEQNKTASVKNVLALDIYNLYHQAAKSDDINKFFPVCDVLDQTVIEISDKYLFNNEHDLNSSKTVAQEGKKRLFDMCKKK